MALYPITNGYTINIVRKKETSPQKSLVICLNDASDSNKPVPRLNCLAPQDEERPQHEEEEEEEEQQVVVRVVGHDELEFPIGEEHQLEQGPVVYLCDSPKVGGHGTEEVFVKAEEQDTEVFVSNIDAVSEVVTEEVVEAAAEEEGEEEEEEEVVVQHETVKLDCVGELGLDGAGKSIKCGTCDRLLASEQESVAHMIEVHGVLTFEGPLFKCDFCSYYVTDRVGHMKRTHYLPLEESFQKIDSAYRCLSCPYTSDQLTNIRNHVDAKHRPKTNRYQCTECKSFYRTLNSMRAHKSRAHVRKRRQE